MLGLTFFCIQVNDIHIAYQNNDIHRVGLHTSPHLVNHSLFIDAPCLVFSDPFEHCFLGWKPHNLQQRKDVNNSELGGPRVSH